MQAGQARPVTANAASAERCGSAGCAFVPAAASSICENLVLAFSEAGSLVAFAWQSAALLWEKQVIPEAAWPGLYKNGAWAVSLATVDDAGAAVVSVQARGDGSGLLQLTGISLTNGTELWLRSVPLATQFT